MDVLYARYKKEIIDPWIRGLTDEGEKSVIGIIEFNSMVVKELVASTRGRAENRYKREPEAKEERVAHLIAINGNLVAANETLRELFVHLEGSQMHPGHRRYLECSHAKPFCSGRLLTLSI